MKFEYSLGEICDALKVRRGMVHTFRKRGLLDYAWAVSPSAVDGYKSYAVRTLKILIRLNQLRVRTAPVRRLMLLEESIFDVVARRGGVFSPESSDPNQLFFPYSLNGCTLDNEDRVIVAYLEGRIKDVWLKMSYPNDPNQLKSQILV